MSEAGREVSRRWRGRRALRRAPIASARLGVELLSNSVHRDILAELVRSGPSARAALTARVHASATRVYGGLKRLRQAGLVDVGGRGRATIYAVTASGRELRIVCLAAERWFGAYPGGGLEPSVGWRAFADLGELWRLGVVEWVVRCQPATGDLSCLPSAVDPGQAAEMLEATEEAGTVVRGRGPDGRLCIRLTPWAAQAIGPLALIARWERRRRPPQAAPIEVGDALVALLAAVPLVRLPAEAGGTFTLTAEMERRAGEERRSGTVWVRLRRGRAVVLGEGVPPEPAIGWASGSFDGWLAAALDGRPRRLRIDGRDPAAIASVGALVAELPVALGLAAN